ncbi:MAG: helicase-related protein [Chloroflexales bacterium]
MAPLEDLTSGARVRGVIHQEIVTIVAVRWSGADAVELTFTDAQGRPDHAVFFRADEPSLEVLTDGLAWTFDGDGERLRLLLEAKRIGLAHLFDPHLAIHTSIVDPLPHQIMAVYGELLPRQPLRYLLADDPGAGKTIMAGLFIKELIIRGDVQRCLIVAPGALVTQWQDELDTRFQMPFAIFAGDTQESAHSGNWFLEHPLAIARLDTLARSADLQSLLQQTEWDLVIFDEAHKLSASFFGGEVRFTRRYRLAQMLGETTRHLLLLTATPHNGKEEDFQLFLALLDADRFAGRFRDGVHRADAGDLMRRLTKEQLLTFDGTPLFPERIATTVPYVLSAEEHTLYEQVTSYVRQEFNRADVLDGGRKGTIGFALTSLQRRLASSPEAIFQSLRRRRVRLNDRLAEARSGGRDAHALDTLDLLAGLPGFINDDLEDLEDAPGDEQEAVEAQLVGQASAARTAAELQAEIAILQQLEDLAAQVRRSGRDKKWEELAGLLQNEATVIDPAGHRRKLVIFTEHRDTLNYLVVRIATLLGRAEAVTVIHGGLDRRERARAEEAFTLDPTVQVLVATDAAGEGINLQRAHLMVNYDLPWNPNRLEQRFGRIHRIGQTEVCHLWNLVAHETREGEVYTRLLRKLEVERDSLGGQVFDVLGRLSFANRPLRDLLVEAIRYGDQPEVRARLSEVVDAALDRDQLRALLDERALAHDSLDVTQVRAIREDLERAAARRLQPHFIGSFFLAAFAQLGGAAHARERGRYELTRVPSDLRQRTRPGARSIILPRYERVSFQKELRTVPGAPEAAFLAPGHPLLDATIAAILERDGDLFTRGALLIDPANLGEQPRVLCALEHRIQDGRPARDGGRRVISRRLQFVEIAADGAILPAGTAPYLDYRAATPAEHDLLIPLRSAPWLQGDLAERARAYAIAQLVPEHMAEVRGRREVQIAKTLTAVKERLTKEIIYWNSQAVAYRAQEQAGKTPRMNAATAERRADEMQERLRRRSDDLAQERRLTAQPPTVIAGALVVPVGLLARLLGQTTAAPDGSTPEARRRIELAAMAAVLQAERGLGFDPHDVSGAKVGYDIESRIPGTGRLRFIEVKGRAEGAETVTVTRNEILTALNKPAGFILALVVVSPDGAPVANAVRYVRRPFTREPDFDVESVNYRWDELWSRGEEPR